MRQQFERINVQGTASVVRAALDEQVDRLLFFSTIAVYGPSGGRVLTEDSPERPESLYARTKLEAEKIVLNASKPGGVQLGTVLRLAAVYGSRVKGNYRRLVLSLARNRFIPIGSGSNRRTLIYDSDVARAALLAIRHPEAAGRIYNVTDGGYHRMQDIIRVICQSLGKKPPHWRLPVRPIRSAAGIMEDAARIAGLSSPISRATINKYTEDLAISGARIKAELGFEPEYDLKKGWSETILEMRRSGEI